MQRRAAERLRFLTPPQGFEQSSTPLTPPQRDPALEPHGEPGTLSTEAGDAPSPPVVDASATAFKPPNAANEVEPVTYPRSGEAIFPTTSVDETAMRLTSGRWAMAKTRLRLPVAPRRIASIGLGALGLVLFGLAVVMILSGRLGAIDLAIGLAGVVLMIPAIHALLGRRRGI